MLLFSFLPIFLACIGPAAPAAELVPMGVTGPEYTLSPLRRHHALSVGLSLKTGIAQKSLSRALSSRLTDNVGKLMPSTA